VCASASLGGLAAALTVAALETLKAFTYITNITASSNKFAKFALFVNPIFVAGVSRHKNILYFLLVGSALSLRRVSFRRFCACFFRKVENSLGYTLLFRP
jgi:hypothetical protein